MYYGWLYKGKADNGKHVVYFWNDGDIVESRFFDTEKEARDFVTRQNALREDAGEDW